MNPAPIKPTITADLLEKLDIRVGTILAVEDVPNSDKLVQLRVSFGDHERIILSGMKQERANPREIAGQAGAVRGQPGAAQDARHRVAGHALRPGIRGRNHAGAGDARGAGAGRDAGGIGCHRVPQRGCGRRSSRSAAFLLLACFSTEVADSDTWLASGDREVPGGPSPAPDSRPFQFHDVPGNAAAVGGNGPRVQPDARVAGADDPVSRVRGRRIRRHGAVARAADDGILRAGGAVDVPAIGRLLSRAGGGLRDRVHRFVFHVGPAVSDHLRADHGDDSDSGIAALDVGCCRRCFCSGRTATAASSWASWCSESTAPNRCGGGFAASRRRTSGGCGW